MRALLVAGMIIWASSAFGPTPVYFTFEAPPRGYDSADRPRTNSRSTGIVDRGFESAEHVMGRIVKRQAPYNTKWSFYLDPQTISFFKFAIEVCDATSH
jgi:hypothetical protein